MKPISKRAFIFILLLLFGSCLAIPTEIYAAKTSVHRKDMGIKLDITKQENNLFAATFTWNKLKECPYYELYRCYEDGKEELLLSVDDGDYKYVVSDLEYGKRYDYIIYAYKAVDGELIRTYYSDFFCRITVSNVFRYMKSVDQINTSKKSISIELSCTDMMIPPEYIEILRVNKLTSAEKKFKLKWEDIEKTRVKSYPEYNFIYTDDTVKPGQVYEYTFKPYIILNEKKVYSKWANTYTLAAYNRIPSCDVKVTHNKKDNTFLVRLKNKKGDAPLMINSDFITKKQAVANPMKLTEISYDGKNYIEARKGLYLFLQEDETIYMKFKGNDIDKGSFRLYFKYFYNPNDETDAWNVILYVNKIISKNNRMAPNKLI